MSSRILARGARYFDLARAGVAAVVATLAIISTVALSRPAEAMNIQTIKSPGGIEAWLVEEHSVPLMALRFAFEGGNSQDPPARKALPTSSPR